MSDKSGGAVDVYTGGACAGNPGPGGWGAILRFGHHEREICGSDAATTIDRMELTAVVRALECLTRSCVVHIRTGSTHVHEGVPRSRPDGRQNPGEPVENADLWRRLATAMASHDVSWHRPGNPGSERANQLAVEGMRQAIADVPASPAPEDECVHEMPIGWCALCKPPLPGVLSHGYRTKAGNAYHNDPNCAWLQRGQRRAERQGKNVHDTVRVAWADVRPGALEPCESCCTPEWVKRHGR